MTKKIESLIKRAENPLNQDKLEQFDLAKIGFQKIVKNYSDLSSKATAKKVGFKNVYEYFKNFYISEHVYDSSKESKITKYNATFDRMETLTNTEYNTKVTFEKHKYND